MDTNLINKKLVVVDRYCGYLLFFLMGAYFITGFGQTKTIFDPFAAKIIHDKWLPLPTFVAFILHSLINLRFILIKKGAQDRLWWNLYLIVLGVIFLGVFLYIYLR